MKSLTSTQIFMLVIATLGVLTASATQLTDLIGATNTHYVIASASLLMSILSGWGAILFGQGNQIKAVQAMPGVEAITVNAQANSTLAQLAVDPAQPKIDVVPAAAAAVAQTAKGA